MIITIDGPAGSGKSTIAKNLASTLGFMFLDTGAMYRVVAWLVMRDGLSLDETDRISRLAIDAKMDFKWHDGVLDIFVDDRDVTSEVRTEAVSEFASRISAIPQVRQSLVEKQRELARKFGDVVTEGRDQGSVVFTNAELKVYLDADVEERAKRRYEQLLEQGQDADFDKIVSALVDRDHRDKTRDISPLIVPDNAIKLDTTYMNSSEVLNKLIELVEESKRK